MVKCRCARVRVEDRTLYHSTPANRTTNISPSSRSNYQLTSLRDMTSLRDRQVIIFYIYWRTYNIFILFVQTIQTSFVENGGGNGHHAQLLQRSMVDDRAVVPAATTKYDNSAWREKLRVSWAKNYPKDQRGCNLNQLS